MVMIIGIVMFVVVGLILYLSKAAVKKTTQQSAGKLQNTAISVQPIEEFVAKCLDKTAKDSIILLGSQAGRTYSSQGGTLVDFSNTDEGLFFVKYNNLNVAYNIKNPSLYLPLPYTSSVPDYPWLTFPYRSQNSNAKNFLGIFGISNMPPLIPSQGQHSIQTQLETYIDKNLANCLDFKIFEQQGYQIAQFRSRTHVTIGEDDVIVNSEIPLTIINAATRETTKLKEFSTTLNLRLEEIYNFVEDLVENDIQDIIFNLTDVKNNKNSFNIKLLKHFYKNDDVVIVEDKQSVVSGRPLEHIFARKNRRPALYCIKNTDSLCKPGQTVLEFERGHDITQNDLLNGQQLKAEDPDEDVLTFNINPSLPKTLDTSQITFKVEVTDGELSDYQYITVKEK